MSVQFPQPDGRGIVRRKWSADKCSGPLVHLAELIVKRLIQEHFPASYVVRQSVIVFNNALGNSPEFLALLDRVAYIVARSQRVGYSLAGNRLQLDRDYVLVPRFAKGSASGKPVAVTFKAVPGSLPF